jgi:hypothetical protein
LFLLDSCPLSSRLFAGEQSDIRGIRREHRHPT